MTRHSVSHLFVHSVFVVKYRRKVLTSELLTVLQVVFDKVCREHGCTLIEFEGEFDHVHLLVQYRPKVRLSDLMRTLKTQSSATILRNYRPIIAKQLWGPALWTPSYFISSCGGAPLEYIKAYIQNQNSPRTQSKDF